MNDVNVLALQDTANVPPRSKWTPAPMPPDWDSNHPNWYDIVQTPMQPRGWNRDA